MSEDKILVPYYSGPRDNFLFWATRIMAILDEKEIDTTIEWEKDYVPSTGEEKKKSKKACSIILRELGDIPMAVVINNSELPQKMWVALHKRFASNSTLQKA